MKRVLCHEMLKDKAVFPAELRVHVGIILEVLLPVANIGEPSKHVILKILSSICSTFGMSLPESLSKTVTVQTFFKDLFQQFFFFCYRTSGLYRLAYSFINKVRRLVHFRKLIIILELS